MEPIGLRDILGHEHYGAMAAEAPRARRMTRQLALVLETVRSSGVYGDCRDCRGGDGP
jgi:hypothetical protein